MKNILLYLPLFLLLGVSSCTKEYINHYSFTIKNSTEDTITIKFLEVLDYGNDIDNKQEVTIFPSEEKNIRNFMFYSRESNDLIKTNFDTMFPELKFNTFINGVKLEKDLWLPDNWTYYKKPKKWEAEYKIIITDNMLGE